MNAAGGLLVVGFEGASLTPLERRLLQRVRPGGVVLFARNLEDVNGVRALTADLRRILPGVVLAVDAEGGRVDRLRGVVGPAPAAADLALRRPEVSRRAGRWVGHSLRLLGFDLDFAPVADLDHGRVGNALDRRCFGRDPRSVTSRAGAFLAGLHEAGVAGCLKHFPGLGAAGEDTHHLASAIGLDPRDLGRDLAPFRRLAPRAEAIMVGHAIYPGWDGSGLPGTLSPAIATALLRDRLEWEGIVFSDDLEMNALGRWGGLAERAALALAAGCDGLLICRRLEESPEVVERLATPSLAIRRQEAAVRWEGLRRHLAEIRQRATGAVPTEGEVRRALAHLASTAGQKGMSSSPPAK